MVDPGDILCRRFEVIKKINEGCFGEIFTAHDSELDSVVAIKQPKCTESGFRKEFESLKALEPFQYSPTPLYFGRSASTAFFAMSLEGQNLKELAGTKGFNESTVPLILFHSLNALKFLHNSDMSHGDISLTNICVPVSPSKARLILIDLSESDYLDEECARRDLDRLVTSVELVGNAHDIFIDLHSLLDTKADATPEDLMQFIKTLPNFDPQAPFQWEGNKK